MSSRASRRRRRAAAARTAPAAPAGATGTGGTGRTRPAPVTRARAAHLDPVALYRDMSGNGRTMRTSLLIGIVLLIVAGVTRSDPGDPPSMTSYVGTGVVLLFFVLSGVNYFRVLYRVRRHDPAAWRPSPAFLARMLSAPFGAGDPGATPYDRWVLRCTVAAALAAAVQSLVHR